MSVARPPHYSENGVKIANMTLNEPHNAAQTAADVHQSLGYNHSREISKVVWNIVPDWFPSIPTIVVRDGVSANVKR